MDAQNNPSTEQQNLTPQEAPTVPTRRVRWPLAIIGGILVLLQIMSIAGSAKGGACPWQLPNFMAKQTFVYDLTLLVGFLFIGIIGAILLAFSFPKTKVK